jgi:hypothetical protein
MRSIVGKGFLLQGVVKSARDCAAIPGADFVAQSPQTSFI